MRSQGSNSRTVERMPMLTVRYVKLTSTASAVAPPYTTRAREARASYAQTASSGPGNRSRSTRERAHAKGRSGQPIGSQLARSYWFGWKSLCPVCQSMKADWAAKFLKVTIFSSVKWPLS